MDPDHLSRGEAAQKTGYTPPTITTYLRAGWLVGYKLGGRWRITRASVDALLRDGPPRTSSPNITT